MSKYKYLAELEIISKYLPSPLKVMVCSNSNTYINKYFENKIKSICEQYNYTGKLDIHIKYLKGSKFSNYKTFYVCKDNKNKIFFRSDVGCYYTEQFTG